VLAGELAQQVVPAADGQPRVEPVFGEHQHHVVGGPRFQPARQRDPPLGGHRDRIERDPFRGAVPHLQWHPQRGELPGIPDDITCQRQQTHEIDAAGLDAVLAGHRADVPHGRRVAGLQDEQRRLEPGLRLRAGPGQGGNERASC
jgi:hypothetical protein